MKKIDTIVIAVGGQGKRITGDLRKRGIKTSKIFLKLNGKRYCMKVVAFSMQNRQNKARIKIKRYGTN